MEGITNSSPENHSEFHAYDKASSYSFMIATLEPEVKQELDQCNSKIDEKVNGLIRNFKSVEKTIKQRNILLLDYQKVNEEYTKLKNKDGELSFIEYKQLYNLESKSDTNKRKYELINKTLKREIPLFLVICQGISSKLFTLIYFTNLAVFYRVSLSFGSFANKFNMSEVEGDTILQEFHKKHDIHSDKASALNIVKFSEVSFTKLNAKINEDLNAGDYLAMYDFHPVQKGDLSFKVGDRIMVTSYNEGWWIGTNERTGLSGAFPYNYVAKRAANY